MSAVMDCLKIIYSLLSQGRRLVIGTFRWMLVFLPKWAFAIR